MTPRLVILGSLTAALFLGSCGKPEEISPNRAPAEAVPQKELPYKQLGYHDGILTEPGGSTPFTGIAKDYHKDGSPKAEYPCRSGKFHGTVKEWHPNGQPLAETEFKDGERTGLNREWTEAGQPYMERVYDHDRIVSEKKFESGK